MNSAESIFKVVPAYPPGTWAWALVFGDILVKGGEYKPDLEETARLLNEALRAHAEEALEQAAQVCEWNGVQSAEENLGYEWADKIRMLKKTPGSSEGRR